MGSFHGLYDSMPEHVYGWEYDPANLAKNLDTYSNGKIKKVCKGTLKDWIAQCVKDNRLPFIYIVPNEEFMDLPKEQRDEMVALCEQQLQYAGYRLAHVMNTIFDPAFSKSKR